MERSPDNSDPLPAIRRAFLAAQSAGSFQGEPLSILASEELLAPIDESWPTCVPRAERTAQVDMPSIKGYRFLREVSHGGQATVFEGVEESTGRKVAIKVIAGGPYLNSRNRARFEREVKALAAVNHKNVVSILDRGRTADDSFFLVMEYAEGRCLDAQVAEWRAREPFDPRLILTLFARIARVINEVHRCGVVHRDLKPSNILVDSRGQPQILDFGLVRLLQDSLARVYKLCDVAPPVMGRVQAAPRRFSLGFRGEFESKRSRRRLWCFQSICMT